MPRNCSPASSGIRLPYVAAEPAADARRPRRPGLPGPRLGRHPAAPSCSCAGCASPASPSSATRWTAAPRGPEPALDLHAGVAELIDGDGDGRRRPASESASRAALAIALVRSAKAAFDATDDDLQRAAGLARHARIELLSRRIDAAMDEAVEAASLLDPVPAAQLPARRTPSARSPACSPTSS